jgi:nitrite reductase/ring-hydroxylating ferredoxin subunit/uncharacterized membrane protein
MLERLGAPFGRFGDWVARVMDGFYRVLGRPGKWLQDFLNGSWLGHPTHPVVTDIVVGGATVVVVFDLAAMLFGATDLDTAALVVVAVTALSALSAVVTGLTDFKDTAKGDERNVAILHGLVNIVATVAYLASFGVRLGGAVDAGRWLSLAGALILAGGAYVGGHLVFKYGYMVNRNAFARGKTAKEFTAVLPLADLADAVPIQAMLGATALVVVRRGDLVFALKDTCSHAGGPLSKGQLAGDTIVCPLHASAFRLRDGAVRHGPAATRQVAYRARISGDQVEVQGPMDSA